MKLGGGGPSKKNGKERQKAAPNTSKQGRRGKKTQGKRAGKKASKETLRGDWQERTDSGKMPLPGGPLSADPSQNVRG